MWFHWGLYSRVLTTVKSRNKTTYSKKPEGKTSSILPPVAPVNHCFLSIIFCFSYIVTNGWEAQEIDYLETMTKGIEHQLQKNKQKNIWSLWMNSQITNNTKNNCKGCSGHGNSTQPNRWETLFKWFREEIMNNRESSSFYNCNGVVNLLINPQPTQVTWTWS